MPIFAASKPSILTVCRIDEKTRIFTDGFDAIAQRVRERFYTSVQDFSRDLSLEIGKVVARYHDQEEAGGDTDADIETIHNQLNEVKPGTAEHHALSQEQKQVKALAKRLVKAVKELLEDALKKEAELKGHEHEEALRKLESMGIFASTKSIGIDSSDEGKIVGKRRSESDVDTVAGASPDVNGDTEMHDADERTDEAVIHLNIAGRNDTVPVPNARQTPASKAASCASSSHDQMTRKSMSGKPTEPPSPPISTDSNAINGANAQAKEDDNDVFAQGGVPWYLEPFDPEGTTVHDERYTGRAVLRDMSEELSDMDEDTLTELAINGVEATPTTNGKGTPAKAAQTAAEKKKAAARKRARNRRR